MTSGIDPRQIDIRCSDNGIDFFKPAHLIRTEQISETIFYGLFVGFSVFMFGSGLGIHHSNLVGTSLGGGAALLSAARQWLQRSVPHKPMFKLMQTDDRIELASGYYEPVPPHGLEWEGRTYVLSGIERVVVANDPQNELRNASVRFVRDDGSMLQLPCPAMECETAMEAARALGYLLELPVSDQRSSAGAGQEIASADGRAALLRPSSADGNRVLLRPTSPTTEHTDANQLLRAGDDSAPPAVITECPEIETPRMTR